MKSLEEIIKYVGISYQQFDEEGKALGCMYPLYLAHPEESRKLRFEWIPEGANARDYMLSLFDKYCTRIPLEELRYGDIVTIKMPFGYYHVALYLENGKLLHCTEARGLEIVKLLLYEGRIERGYRWNGWRFFN